MRQAIPFFTRGKYLIMMFSVFWYILYITMAKPKDHGTEEI